MNKTIHYLSYGDHRINEKKNLSRCEIDKRLKFDILAICSNEGKLAVSLTGVLQETGVFIQHSDIWMTGGLQIGFAPRFTSSKPATQYVNERMNTLSNLNNITDNYEYKLYTSSNFTSLETFFASTSLKGKDYALKRTKGSNADLLNRLKTKERINSLPVLNEISQQIGTHGANLIQKTINKLADDKTFLFQRGAVQEELEKQLGKITIPEIVLDVLDGGYNDANAIALGAEPLSTDSRIINGIGLENAILRLSPAMHKEIATLLPEVVSIISKDITWGNFIYDINDFFQRIVGFKNVVNQDSNFVKHIKRPYYAKSAIKALPKGIIYLAKLFCTHLGFAADLIIDDMYKIIDYLADCVIVKKPILKLAIDICESIPTIINLIQIAKRHNTRRKNAYRI
ncbi:MAG: hypothetical protein FWE03_00115 [Firmicutes bacterium]|nr:hypothetical protein [Bacillota bacterium]